MESLNLQPPTQSSQTITPPPVTITPPPPQPIQPVPDYSFDDTDLFAGLTGDRKLSADTVVDPDTGIIETVPGAAIDNGDRLKMDESEAMKQTRTLMDMRETGQALALSYAAEGKLDDYAKYKYEPWQKNLLVEAWAPLIQQFGIRVSPWIKVLYAEGVSTTPLVVLAVQNRNQRLKIQQQAAYIADLQRENDGLRTQASAKQKPLRSDTKNQWKIDENGYFENNVAGAYIKKPNRMEKPDLSPDSYELLCRHNGKEFVDRVFNIGNDG